MRAFENHVAIFAAHQKSKISEDGEVFRSGCCYRHEWGRIFAFRPGHETFPIYEQPEVLDIIANAADWAAPTVGATVSTGRTEPLEELE